MYNKLLIVGHKDTPYRDFCKYVRESPFYDAIDSLLSGGTNTYWPLVEKYGQSNDILVIKYTPKGGGSKEAYIKNCKKRIITLIEEAEHYFILPHSMYPPSLSLSYTLDELLKREKKYIGRI